MILQFEVILNINATPIISKLNIDDPLYLYINSH